MTAFRRSTLNDQSHIPLRMLCLVVCSIGLLSLFSGASPEAFAAPTSEVVVATPGNKNAHETFSYEASKWQKNLRFRVGDTAEEKAINLAKAINAQGVKDGTGETAVVDKDNPRKVVLTRAKNPTLGNETQEQANGVMSRGDSAHNTFTGESGFQEASGSLGFTGLDHEGLAATYDAGFSLSGGGATISLYTHLNYSQLSIPTVDGLLSQQFSLLHGQLLSQKPDWSSWLELDLANSLIRFETDAGSWDSFEVWGGTTDSGLWSTVSLTVSSVPEIDPASCGSVVAFVIGALGFVERKSRRRWTSAATFRT